MPEPVALASAWMPRGELERFRALCPVLAQVYANISVSLPPDADPTLVRALEGLDVRVVVTTDWSHGRHDCLRLALATGAPFIQYVDFERLLRWASRLTDEWRATVDAVRRADCLVIGRTPAAYATHPQALVQTEAVSNHVFSHLLGQPLDLSAGAKGFSRRAAEMVLASSAPGRALGMDSAWVVLCHRAGFCVESLLVDGLDWESADHHRAETASRDEQRRAAAQYDSDPANWARRVAVAQEIVEAGLSAWETPFKLHL
jgi:hypothetical protein